MIAAGRVDSAAINVGRVSLPAATAASLALDAEGVVQDVPYASLRERLLADGQILDWGGEP